MPNRIARRTFLLALFAAVLFIAASANPAPIYVFGNSISMGASIPSPVCTRACDGSDRLYLAHSFTGDIYRVDTATSEANFFTGTGILGISAMAFADNTLYTLRKN